MKTKEVLDKYRKIIGGLVGVKPEDVKFYTTDSYGISSKGTYSVLRIGNHTKEIAEIEYFEPEKDKEGNKTGTQIRQTRWNDWSEGTYVVTNEKAKDVIAGFKLYKLPHCCAILVSCNALVYEQYRNKRVGTILNNLRQDIGRLLGYSTLLCTDIESNKHQRQLLKTNGWKDIYDVTNKRTGNKVYMSVINL